jgi:hypothetical protein
MSHERRTGLRSREALSRSRLRALVAFIGSAALTITLTLTSDGSDQCLAREGKKHILSKEDVFTYQRKLFLTPDEIARYVFLTNRKDDGDRSAAVYRAEQKRQDSLPGGYWVTATVASDSLSDHPNVSVRRFDAPLPASLAIALHELWLAVCQNSRINEEALPSAPTGMFSVVQPRGPRLTVVTVSLIGEHSRCLSLLNLGESLIDYSKLPAAKRPQAARQIEAESHRLQHLWK